ncbi:MAG: hemerythrin domain-containing protein [Eikenella sp.]|nr:hemerythrin domain-containing protein [Eikenella sp.]
MDDLFRTRSATFDEPIAMLRACHDKVRRFCDQLNRLPGYLKAHGYTPTAAQAVRQIRHYFNTAAPLHHQDEEADFFPLLLRYVPEAAAAVNALAAEHGGLHRSWAVLDRHLAALSAEIEADADLIRRFTDAYARHMPVEEQLFAQGGAQIPPAELARIGRRMAARRQG